MGGLQAEVAELRRSLAAAKQRRLDVSAGPSEVQKLAAVPKCLPGGAMARSSLECPATLCFLVSAALTTFTTGVLRVAAHVLAWQAA